MTTRESGYLRVTPKTAKGKKYKSWQWCTHHHHDLGHKRVDLELGSEIDGLRSRVYAALGEIKPELIAERWVAFNFRNWRSIPAFTGIHGQSGAAWWISFPTDQAKSVKLTFRSNKSYMDFRRKWVRLEIEFAEIAASNLWRRLKDDPILELGRLQWQEKQARDAVAKYLNDKLPALRKAKRNGEISKRDFEADECRWMVNVEGFEGIASASASKWDEHLAEMVSALPRTRRTELKPRVIAMADRHYNDAATQNRWHADQ